MSGYSRFYHTPPYCFVGQIHCSFHCFTFTKTIAFFYTLWPFITTASNVTNCIIGIKWASLIPLFGFINNSNHNIFVLSFNNFDFESEDWIIRHNLVENKLRIITIKFTNVIYSAAGNCLSYFEFSGVRLVKITNIDFQEKL